MPSNGSPAFYAFEPLASNAPGTGLITSDRRLDPFGRPLVHA